MSCMDQSLYAVCTKKSKTYGLVYASVMGINLLQPTHIYSYLVDIQKENSLEVLSKFFSGEFTESFALIAEQSSIIEKIKNAFDKLQPLLD